MYGSRHFADYHALLTLSDAIGFQGIEHHQSSDDRASDDFLTDPDQSLAGGDLIPHEFSHSWNGKYRRPADLTTPNFQVPQLTDLLWVYEGMNQYLGDVLSFRSGIREPKLFPEYLATAYAQMDYETGRTTTPLIDLTTGAPYYYNAHGVYRSDSPQRRRLLYGGRSALARRRHDHPRAFAWRAFAGHLPASLHRARGHGADRRDLYARASREFARAASKPYDWHAFFEKYVYHPAVHPPTDELARAGWKIAYTTKPNEFITAQQADDHGITGWYAYGANLSAEGVVSDVRENSPAWRAGLAPGMHVLAVNGQQFSSDVLDYALKRAEHSTAPISLITTQTGWYQTLSLDYHGGIRYPHLERIAGTPDMLAAIVAPHAK